LVAALRSAVLALCMWTVNLFVLALFPDLP
jgi:hypothetical protein